MIPRFLSGYPSVWFRRERDHIQSYNEFKLKFLRAFDDENYDRKILDTILTTKQKDGENATEYFDNMISQYKKFSNPPAEYDIVNSIIRNVTPINKFFVEQTTPSSVLELKNKLR
ncbi:Uncharacterised protein at_DN1202 [Pycnogonum litorale]